MKYLFINSVCGYGSTGKIVTAKCHELMAQGHECRIAHGVRLSLPSDIPELPMGSRLDFVSHALQSRLLDRHAFASFFATKRLVAQIRQYDPDVIWMHNLHGYYLHVGVLFDYLRTCGKEIRWTLHDCWSFTGHCSHFENAQCDRWKTGCYSCPQKREYPASILLDCSRRNYEKKKALFTGIPNLTIYVPSQWLARLIGESFLKAYPVKVVHNTIDKTVFCPTPGTFREEHGLENKYMVLGVSSMWDNTKGLQHFCDLAKALGEQYRVVLVGIPEELKKQLPPEILAISRTENRRQLAEIYSAADVFVNPTLEDTYPTVNLEAVACGCRVVTFDTGGCPETVTPEDILVPRGNGTLLLEKIREVCEKGDA